MWKNLGGEIKAHVTLNNLRIFLFAIMGTFVEPGLPRETQKLTKIDNNEYGFFNEQGDLFLDISEVSKIQKSFQPLYLNRMQFEAKQREIRKQEKLQAS